MSDFFDHPGRPDNADFWELSKAVLANDASIAEDGKTLDEVVGQYVDPETLTYMAMQRGLRAVGPAVTGELLVKAASAFIDGFTAACRYMTDKNGTHG